MPRTVVRMLWAFAIVVLLSLAATAVAPAATGTTLTVNVTSDLDQNGVGGCATGGSCSLREAVNQANLDSADTIKVLAGAYALNPAFGQLALTADATLSGTGAASTTISGASATRILRVSSGATVALSGVTLQNGNASGDRGGAVLVSPGGSLTVAACVLTASTDVNGGGAIEDEGALAVSDSTISDNLNPANGPGGGIEVTNLSASGTVTATIDATTISGNSAVSGGGLEVENRTTGTGTVAVTISHSMISDNAAVNGSGGGIEANLGAVTLSVSDSTVYGNTANGTGVGSGGGVALAPAPSSESFTSDTIANNDAETGAGGNVDVKTGSSPPLFQDTIVSGGVGVSSSQANCAGTVTSEGHNLDSRSQCGFASTGDITSADPMLGMPADNGGPTQTMALHAGSPAIDAGGSCAQTDDQRGVARPQGRACDIGAYEVAPPTVGAQTASAVARSSATLAAQVANPDAQSGTVSFEYGTTTSYGTTTAAQPIATQAATAFSAVITGLSPGTTYHYRVIATNPDGTSSGTDQTFTTIKPTPPRPPSNFFTLGKIIVSANGVLNITVRAPGAGRFVAKATFRVKLKHGKRKTYVYGSGSLKSSSKSSGKIKIRIKHSAALELKKLASTTVTMSVTFTPTGGTARTKRTKLKVKRSRSGRYS